jgi:hypothetical protein
MAFFAAEMVARRIPSLNTGTSWEHRIPHPRFGWVLEPSVSYVNRLPEESVAVSHNAEGWRDLPRAKNKDDGVMRIVVLGDSFMEAFSVNFEDALPARLERLISTAERRVEVINLGVGGYSTLQEYLVFDTVGREYRPDVVVLAMYLNNDLAENTRELQLLQGKDRRKIDSRPFLDPQVEAGWRITDVDFRSAQNRYEENRRQRWERQNRLVRNSALLQLAQRLWGRLKTLGADEPMPAPRVGPDLSSFVEHYCDEPPEVVQAWNVTKRILARLNQEVRATGARLLAMSVPPIHEVDEDVMTRVLSQFSQPDRLCLEQAIGYRRLAELLGELDIDYLDLMPAFRYARRQTGVELFRRSDLHWNPQGHALAARELAAALEDRGYLEARLN